MFAQSWIYDAILYTYALSLLFMFADFAHRNPRAKRLGTGLLAFVWVLQTVFLLGEASSASANSLFSMFSSLFFFSWLIVTFSLTLTFIMRVDALFFVNLAGFASAALTFFTDRTLSGAALGWNVRDDLLFIHISLALAGYAAFLFSALFSVMLIVLYDMLKGKRWSERLIRMPSLGDIKKWAQRFALIGTPLLLLSLVLGVVWVTLGREWALFADWKVLNTLLILAVYSFYIWQSFRGALVWTRLAIVNLIGFVAVICNFIFSNWLSGFH